MKGIPTKGVYSEAVYGDRIYSGNKVVDQSDVSGESGFAAKTSGIDNRKVVYKLVDGIAHLPIEIEKPESKGTDHRRAG
jgi:hypothetical protein